MSGFEIVAVVVFFLLGYWLVDYIWPKKKAATTQGARVTVRVARSIEGPLERVFDAWLDPASAGKWLFATPEGEMVKVEIDPRPGGRFLFVDRRNGEDIEHSGEYLAIDRPRKLAFNFVVPKFSEERSLVELDFEQTDGGTDLKLSHAGVLPEYAARTEEGWLAILDGLARQLG
jgi:uncharacterized protein YndB with AHSA1/START domain